MEEPINNFTCSVCLNEEVEENKRCITECNHFFCLDCMNNWFNQRTISCPMCRQTIKLYRINGEHHHIISLNTNRDTTHDNNLRMELLQLRNRNYYANIMLFLFFIYFIYSLYENSILIIERDDYKLLYKNCSDELIKNNVYIEMIEDKDHLSTIPVFLNHRLYNCFFPIYYVQKCLLKQN